MILEHWESSSVSHLVSHFSSNTDTCAAPGFTAKDLVILRTPRAHTNHVQEILLVNVPARLQDTQEATAALAHSTDLRLCERRSDNARMIKSGDDTDRSSDKPLTCRNIEKWS